MKKIAVLVVLLALGGFVAWELVRDEATGVRETAEFVFPFNSGRVAELSLTIRDVGAATFRREGGTGPFEVVEGSVEGVESPDPEFVADLIGVWANLRFAEVVIESPSDEELARFELDNPKALVSAKLIESDNAPSPRHPPRLEVGAPTPLQPGYYARLDGFERVVVVTPAAIEMFEGAGRLVLGLDSNMQEPERGAITPR